MEVLTSYRSTPLPSRSQSAVGQTTLRNRRKLGMARILMSIWRPSSGTRHIESELTEPSQTDPEPRTGTVSAIAGTSGKLTPIYKMKHMQLEPHHVTKPSPHLSATHALPIQQNVLSTK